MDNRGEIVHPKFLIFTAPRFRLQWMDMLRNPNSARRPATCAEPTNAAAAIAAAGEAPASCSSRGTDHKNVNKLGSPMGGVPMCHGDGRVAAQFSLARAPATPHPAALAIALALSLSASR